MAGANVMIPGLTSAGGILPEATEENQLFAIFCEGKENPLSIAKSTMSKEAM